MEASIRIGPRIRGCSLLEAADKNTHEEREFWDKYVGRCEEAISYIAKQMGHSPPAPTSKDESTS